MPPQDPDVFDVEIEDEEADEVLVEYDIAAYPSDYTLEVLYSMWGDGKKDITIPEFQRGFVWSIRQSSRLIESFLIGLPVPPIFFYIDKDNKNLVVDGQQRILSIMYYFEGYFGKENEKGKRQVFKLTGLNRKSPYHDKKFTDLNETEQRKLNGAVLRAINIRQLSPKEENTSIYHIFERLNTGGTPLTSQEIRNVVFRGKFIQLLKSLNNDKNWRAIIGKKTPDKHFKDVELLLRAFGLTYHLDEYEKPMSEFLNVIAKRYKNADLENIEHFKSAFPVTCGIIKESLRDRPFSLRGPLNTSVFDSVFCSIIQAEIIPSNLNERFEAMIQDQTFIDLTSLGTTDTKTVQRRFAFVKENLFR